MQLIIGEKTKIRDSLVKTIYLKKNNNPNAKNIKNRISKGAAKIKSGLFKVA